LIELNPDYICNATNAGARLHNAQKEKHENMSNLYKLTDGDGQTRGGTQWGPGVSHSVVSDQQELDFPDMQEKAGE